MGGDFKYIFMFTLYLGFHDPIWPSFFNHQDKVSKAFAKHNHPWSRFTKVKSWSDARLRFVGKGQTPGRVVEVVSRGAEFPHFLVLGKIHCKIWVFPKNTQNGQFMMIKMDDLGVPLFLFPIYTVVN